MKIPVIDIFAGPGGLGEGFSSVFDKDKRVFDIRLSIEMDTNAHETLELRSFVRQFSTGRIPDKYYQMMQESEIIKRAQLKKQLFQTYSDQYEDAKNEAWQAELGGSQFPPEMVDERIREKVGNEKNWVLIGGPPCQAYSLVGRSRRQWKENLDGDDHRVHLYKEYLRIIAVHHPAVFVMENVKGLLSSKLDGEKIFPRILRDLRSPGTIFKKRKSPRYKIYSLITRPDRFDKKGNPIYVKDQDFLIRSEKYGVPQKRHRVILLGIRADIDVQPGILTLVEDQVTLSDVISDLPKLRSGLNRSFIKSELVEVEGKTKKKRFYKTEKDSDKRWQKLMSTFRSSIISWNGFAASYKSSAIAAPKKGTGAEFVPCDTPAADNPLSNWYRDARLDGAANHQSRSHLLQDLKRYMFSSMFTETYERFPRLHEFNQHGKELLPDHENAESGKFADRFRVQLPDQPATTVTSHISKDGHYFIHYDPDQCRSLTVREAARIQTFPDNYLFCGSRTAQYHQVGNAVPPFLAKQIGEVVTQLFNEIRSMNV